MATELHPVAVATPATVTVVTPVIKRPIWGRVFDAVLLALGLVVGLSEYLAGFDLTSVGLTPEQAGKVWLATIFARFLLGQMKPKLLEVKAEPAAPRRDGI